MENQVIGLEPKSLSLTYEQYEKRGGTIKNYLIDKYVVYDLIGVGSYGCVYRGMDDETKKSVAVKLIDMRKIKNQPNQVVKAIKLRLAQSQPRLMFMCKSDFLLKCYDLYQNEDLKVLIIEYCNGKTLQAQIDQKKRIPESQAWSILKQIINGLMVMHSHKIVHRDLKAENIMSHNGTYKIIDFGFSKKLQILQEGSQVRNTSLGTITTMAPQVMSRKPYGLKADIWSLGIIFFQMIYGVYPYDSSTAPQMYREIQSKKIFNQTKRLTLNGFTPSQEAHDFLRMVLVVETDQRPNWQAISQYPYIKNAGSQSNLNQRFIKECDVVYDGKLDCDAIIAERSDFIKNSMIVKKQQFKENEDVLKFKGKEEEKLEKEEQERFEQFVKEIEVSPLAKFQNVSEKKQVILMLKEKQQVPPVKPQEQQKPKEPIKKKINLQQIMKIEKEKEEKRAQEKQAERLKMKEMKKVQKKGQKKIGQQVRKLNNDQAVRKQKQQNHDEQEQYRWTQNAYLQCLKTEFVFREIIYPLQIGEILKKDDRASIQFYYLLCARCFNNMSPIHDEYNERKRSGKNLELINNLKGQITDIYTQVQVRFNQFSMMLTESENKVKSMVFDWFAKTITKSSFQEKDRFMTGIQNLQYSKQDQIDYTFKYYNEYIRKTVEKATNVTNVVKRLQNYPKIMKVKLQYLQNRGKTFKQFTLNTVSGK